MTSKILLGTTALAAILLSTGAQAADDGISLKMAGWFRGYAQFGSLDDNPANGLANRRNVSFETFDSEIHFIAEGKTAGGMTYGFRVELEGNSGGNGGGNDQIDESYLYLRGSYGDLFLGDDDGAANKLAYQVPTPTRSGTLSMEDANFAPNAPGGTVLPYLDSPNHFALDATKAYYATPRFSGFQFGISYTPDLSEDSATPAPGTSNYGGFETDNDNQAQNAIEAGVNYNNKFGDLGVTASFTFYHDEPESGTAVTADDRNSFALGAGILYKGFAIGANYQYTDNFNRSGYNRAGIDGAELNQFVVGTRYITGPWSVGGNLGYGKVEDAAGVPGREDELLALLGGVGYNVAPGMELEAGIHYYDWDSNVATGAGDGASTSVFLGTTLSF